MTSDSTVVITVPDSDEDRVGVAELIVPESDESSEDRVDVAEAISPPRVCSQARVLGLVAGFSADISDGVRLADLARAELGV